MPSHLALTVGNIDIIALTDMSFPFPMPLDELWSEVPTEAWEPFRQRYPDTFHERPHAHRNRLLPPPHP